VEVILTQDVSKVGYKGDLVKVKNGFGRNFLIPQGLAVVATETNRKIMAENLRQASHKLEQQKQEAVQLSEKLNATTLVIKVKTGVNGKIFGNVTTLQIAQALQEKGIEVDRRKISIVGEIKEAGEYTAKADLHREAKAEFKLMVESEG